MVGCTCLAILNLYFVLLKVNFAIFKLTFTLAHNKKANNDI